MRDIRLLCLDGECRAAWVKSLTVALLRKSQGITHASAAGEDLIIWKKIDFPERDFYSDKVLAGRRKCCESSLRASDMQGDEHEWKMNTEGKRSESYIRARTEERCQQWGNEPRANIVCMHLKYGLKQRRSSLIRVKIDFFPLPYDEI